MGQGRGIGINSGVWCLTFNVYWNYKPALLLTYCLFYSEYIEIVGWRGPPQTGWWGGQDDDVVVVEVILSEAAGISPVIFVLTIMGIVPWFFHHRNPIIQQLMHITKLLIFVLSFYHAHAQNCLPFLSTSALESSPITQFDIGAVHLAYPGKPERYNYYNVTLSRATNPYTVVVGVGFIQKYFDLTKLEFQARAIPKTPTMFTILFMISTTANWASAHIHYIATSRDQIQVGDFAASNPELLNVDTSNKPKSIKISYNFAQVKKYAGNANSAQARAYISGIQSNERFLELSITETSVNAKEGIIYVTTNAVFQRTPIDTLIISYIIYNTFNTALTYTIVDSQSTSALKQSIERTNNSTFLGITKASFKDVPKRMLIQIASIQQFTRNFEIQGINFVSGLRAGLTTGSALLSTIPIIGAFPFANLSSNCTTLQGCKDMGGTIVSNPNGISCVVCRPNSQFNFTSNVCVCLPDYFDDEAGQCVSLDTLCLPRLFYRGSCYTQTQKIIGGPCKLTEFFNIATKQCACRPGFNSYISSSTGQRKCVAACLNGLQFDLVTQKCLCRTNFMDNKGNCLKCEPRVSEYNAALGKCECLSKFVDADGKCLQCSPNSTYSSVTKDCKCNPGYVGTGIICRPQTSRLGASPLIITFSNSAKTT